MCCPCGLESMTLDITLLTFVNCKKGNAFKCIHIFDTKNNLTHRLSCGALILKVKLASGELISNGGT